MIAALLPLMCSAVSAQGWPPRNGATLPATCTVGEIFYVTTATTTTPHRCTDDNPDTWIPFEATTSTEINVKDYGAVCNGVTDDSTALQAAFDAADDTPVRVVKLPAATCVFNTPLVVGNNFPGYSHVTIEGVNRDLSVLAYGGASNLVAVQIRHNAYFEMRHFSVTFSGTKGTTVGIGLDASTEGGTGTQVVTGTLWHIGVSGFNIGLRYGGGADQAASEIACWHCQLQNNDTGFASLSQNSLNFWFYNLGLSGNTCGMFLTGESPHVDGGHSANNDTDFCIAGTFGVFTIQNWRAEIFNATDEFISSTGGDRLVVRNSIITANDDQVLLDLDDEHVVLENNIIEGKVTSKGNNTLRVVGNILIPAADGRPVAVLDINSSHQVEVEFWGNVDFLTALRLKDERGLYTMLNMTPWVTELNGENDPPGGGLALNSTRSLAYGSATAGRNIRDSVTFGSSATANFTFKKTVTVSTTSGNNTITFTSGVITAIDVGKRILIPNVATQCLGGQTDDDYVARIATLASATSATLIPQQWHGFTNTRCQQVYPFTTGSVGSTIVGDDEPDANYFITGLSCSASGETFGWSAIATTGFTLTSSNSSSTATCNFTIIR